MELTKENLIDEINKKFQQLEELWAISDAGWKELSDDGKQLVYKNDLEIYNEIYEKIISCLPNTESFYISEFGSLKSKELDLTISIHDVNIEIERGSFDTQEYQYHIIEFNKKDFQKYLFDFFEKDMNWYKRNNGICK